MNCQNRECKIEENYKKCHKANALCVKCLDFRFAENATENLEKEFRNCFDVFALAGAELFIAGMNPRPDFRSVFLQNLEIAVEFHRINLVIAVSHRDCLAYLKTYGVLSYESERELHIYNLIQMKKLIMNYYQIEFRGYFQHLDGSLELVV